MGRIGFGEILVVALVALLLFGANKLPEIASALGKAVREFQKASKEPDEDKHGRSSQAQDGTKVG